MRIARDAEVFAELLRRDAHALLPAADFAGRLAADGRDGALELAHARLAGIPADQGEHGLVREAHHALFHAVLLPLLWQQVAPGDLKLFIFHVALQLYDLHAVEKRPGDRVGRVRGRDEHDLGKVVVHLEEVVAEGMVLRAVEHLEHGRGGVSAKVGSQLVDLVEQQHRVYCARFSHGRNHAARHGADIGAAVAADLGLVVDAAEAHAHELAPERARDGARDAGFAHARGSDEAEYLPVDFAREPRHGDVLDDALLDLLEAEVILVEYPARALEVEVVLGRLAPGELEHALDVVAHLRRFVRAAGQVAVTVDLALERLFDGLGHILLFERRQEGVAFALLVLAELAADDLHLLAQEVFLLIFVYALLDLLLDAAVDAHDLGFGDDAREHILHALLNVELLEHVLPLPRLGHDGVGDGVRKLGDALGARNGLERVGADARGDARVIRERGVKPAAKRLRGDRVRRDLPHGAHGRAHILARAEGGGARPDDALHERAHGIPGKGERLPHAADRAHLEEILARYFVFPRVLLRADEHQPVLLRRGGERLAALAPAGVEM